MAFPSLILHISCNIQVQMTNKFQAQVAEANKKADNKLMNKTDINTTDANMKRKKISAKFNHNDILYLEKHFTPQKKSNEI